eukprot:4991884-Pyramimonas_sp.AAC.1
MDTKFIRLGRGRRRDVILHLPFRAMREGPENRATADDRSGCSSRACGPGVRRVNRVEAGNEIGTGG